MVASDKPRKRFRLARLTLTTSVAILITAALTAAWFEQKRNEYEEYEAYSAYLSDEVSNDAHDWGVGDTVLVVIERFTEVGVGENFIYSMAVCVLRACKRRPEPVSW
jgi:hypothetical protein